MPTVTMAMMLDSDTQNLECVHANGCVLDALFALEDEVDGAGQKADEGIPLRGGEEYLAKLQS